MKKDGRQQQLRQQRNQLCGILRGKQLWRCGRGSWRSCSLKTFLRLCRLTKRWCDQLSDSKKLHERAIRSLPYEIRVKDYGAQPTSCSGQGPRRSALPASAAALPGIVCLARGRNELGDAQHLFTHIDRAIAAQRQSQMHRTDAHPRSRFPILLHPHHGIESVVLQFRHNHASAPWHSIPCTRFFSRSCVIGRGVVAFSISSAMAFASYRPTQMGRTVSLSTSFRITIGALRTRIHDQTADLHFDVHRSSSCFDIRRLVRQGCWESFA